MGKDMVFHVFSNNYGDRIGYGCVFSNVGENPICDGSSLCCLLNVLRLWWGFSASYRHTNRTQRSPVARRPEQGLNSGCPATQGIATFKKNGTPSSIWTIWNISSYSQLYMAHIYGFFEPLMHIRCGRIWTTMNLWPLGGSSAPVGWPSGIKYGLIHDFSLSYWSMWDWCKAF